MNNSNKKIKTVGLIILLSATALLAEISIPYNNSKPPTLLLPDAYERAITALGAATNQFHCISATIDTRFSSEGEWYFTFYSTNSRPKWVTIEFNGKIHIEDMEMPR